MMKWMKVCLILITIAILVGVLNVYVYVGTYIFPIAPYWVTQLPPNPPSPKIKHGEFSFKLEYEMNGIRKVIKDTLICDFDGFEVNAVGGSKRRKWKSYFVSGNTRITLFKDKEREIFYTPNINHWEAGAFYMGDTEIYSSINEVFPNAWQTSDFENKQVNAYIISADEMWEKYKIKLISWEIDPPIKNEFK